MDGKIYEAITAVMKDIGIVGKNDVNKTQGFAYRGIDAVMNALNPAMIKNKVFCVPEVLEQRREERTSKNGGLLIYSVCKIRYRFFTIDGSSVDAIIIGEGMDSGDKATNKAMAIAFKYACFQVFCIPTAELINDPDSESHELKNPKSEYKRATESQKKVIRSICERHGVDVFLLYSMNNTTEEKISAEGAALLLTNLKKKYGEA